MAQRLYECMFLLDGGRYATDPQGTEKALKDLLDRCEVEIVSQGPWQDGKLAYPIDGHKKGLHYLVYFKMAGSKVPELTRLCHLSDLVIRHLLIQHPEKLFDMLSHTLAQHATGKGDGEGEQSPAQQEEPVEASA